MLECLAAVRAPPQIYRESGRRSCAKLPDGEISNQYWTSGVMPHANFGKRGEVNIGCVPRILDD